MWLDPIGHGYVGSRNDIAVGPKAFHPSFDDD